eukprot:CAMPEP_0184710216 /NCGR_PEP_ID=MMETSP0314-20130426/1113_1 /TAXON_ID=38298 /ORGANISM="Rhodella maculata, Strain CCMP 736" /LENGTH=95 /DNA_ID=CAMNT_0027172019 /DNA_START=29 /DNA_END=317 /DNA_ORIENTATION=+
MPRKVVHRRVVDNRTPGQKLGDGAGDIKDAIKDKVLPTPKQSVRRKAHKKVVVVTTTTVQSKRARKLGDSAVDVKDAAVAGSRGAANAVPERIKG